MDDTCGNCGGTGQEFPNCGTCDGAGWIDDPSDGGTMTCPECEGEICSECGGSGYVEEDDEDEEDG